MMTLKTIAWALRHPLYAASWALCGAPYSCGLSPWLRGVR
jgi:hypothetical protein